MVSQRDRDASNVRRVCVPRTGAFPRVPVPSLVPSRGRTWGPFNGRQLTVLIVSLMIGLVMIPSTVWAIDTFSNVAIEDPVSGVKASVDSTKHLAVAGTVRALPASPAAPFSFSLDVSGNAFTHVVGPTASAINLTALALSAHDPSGPRSDFYLYVGSQPPTQASCTGSFSSSPYEVADLPPGQPFVESFPTPLVVPHPATGATNCRYAFTSSLAGWTLDGSGFLGQ